MLVVNYANFTPRIEKSWKISTQGIVLNWRRSRISENKNFISLLIGTGIVTLYLLNDAVSKCHVKSLIGFDMLSASDTANPIDDIMIICAETYWIGKA